VIAGALDPGERQRYHPKLASNLRGRLLQLLPPAMAGIRDAESQDPRADTRYVLVGREGLFSGCQSPMASGGFHAGGFKFVRADGPDRISRAAGKLIAALTWLRLRGPLPQAGAHWLEFGASPGGMTAELLRRGDQVTAVDRAALDPRLDGAPGLRFVEADAADFRPQAGARFAALLCDINGEPAAAARQAFRHAPALEAGAPVIFTLKLPTSGDLPAMLEAMAQVRRIAGDCGLTFVAATHLGQNRHELTLCLAKTGE
jgi:23S rRNA (cytidine2498-2'-O)-methyltransferase